LRKLLEGGEGVAAQAAAIKRFENQADDITREVLLAIVIEHI
jgi:uncharacterized protein Yka (UPF0111/DUF47 family)